MDRILRQVEMHTRLSASVSKSTIALDYGQVLKDHVIAPLVKLGANGVDQAVSNMRDYFLLREDLDGLIELSQWPDKQDPLWADDSKTKAAFTRKFNKMGGVLPYSIALSVSKKKGEEDENMTFYKEEKVFEDEEKPESIENDPSIRIKKIKLAGNI